jgi:hypothetical protein
VICRAFPTTVQLGINQVLRLRALRLGREAHHDLREAFLRETSDVRFSLLEKETNTYGDVIWSVSMVSSVSS